jgi:MFS family permease
MAVSVVNTGCFFGTALMQPLFGWLADQTWNGTIDNGIRVYSAADYHHGFMAMLVFALIALAAALMVKETRCRNIYV